MKDNFSASSPAYSKFRPHYPEILYDSILNYTKGRSTAWDCATGNGQVAAELADFFNEVYATDISENQLANSIHKKNIIYLKEEAESPSFGDDTFDLITVAQAVHWFHFQKFYRQVNRVMKNGGTLALIGYGIMQFHNETDKVIQHLYENILGDYWDPERRLVDDAYQTIPFPFNEIQVPETQMRYQWTLDHLIGFLGTWSAVKHYREKNNSDPIAQITTELRDLFEDDTTMEVSFPIFLRLGIVEK